MKVNKLNRYQEGKRVRLQRVEAMLREIKRIPNDKFIALIEYEIGVEHKTAVSYLRTLHHLEKIKWDKKTTEWFI